MPDSSNVLADLVERYVDERTSRYEWERRTGRLVKSHLLTTFRRSSARRPEDLPGVIAEWEALHSLDSPSTRKHRSGELRTFCRWLWRIGVIPEDVAAELPRDHVRRRTPIDRRVDVEAILAVAQGRERLVIALMGHCGLRRVEVARLRWTDVRLTDGLLLVHGKGQHERVLDLRGAAPYVAEAWSKHCRPDGFVVASHRRWPEGINETKVWQDARSAMDRAGDSSPPKMLRREAAARLAEEGATLEEIAEFLGHVDVDAVDAYLPSVLFDRRLTKHHDAPRVVRIPRRFIATARWEPSRRTTDKNQTEQSPEHVDELPLQELVDCYLLRKQDEWLPAEHVRCKRELSAFAVAARTVDFDSIHAWLTRSEPSRVVVARRFAFMRGFIRHLIATGVIRSDPMTPMRPPRPILRVPRVVTREDVDRLLEACDDKALLCCLLVLCQALLPSEIARLNVGDLDLDEMVFERDGLPMPLSADVALVARRYLAECDDPSRPLVPRRVGGRSTAAGISLLITSAFQKAEVPGNARQLRATATANFVVDAPIHAARDAASHKDFRSTLRFVRLAPTSDARHFVARTWPVKAMSSERKSVTLREAAELLGVSMSWLRGLRRQLGIEGQRISGETVLLEPADVERLRLHLAQHRRGNPYITSAQVSAEIVRLRRDDRSFAWIARRLNESLTEPGRSRSWTEYGVRVQYEKRVNG